MSGQTQSFIVSNNGRLAIARWFPGEGVHGIRSRYVETFWLPVIGPTSLVLARRLDAWLNDAPDGLSVPLEAIGAQVGIGPSTGRSSPLVRSLARLLDFRLARRGVRSLQWARPGEPTLELAATLPDLPERFARRLPEALQLALTTWVSA